MFPTFYVMAKWKGDRAWVQMALPFSPGCSFSPSVLDHLLFGFLLSPGQESCGWRTKSQGEERP